MKNFLRNTLMFLANIAAIVVFIGGVVAAIYFGIKG